MEDLNLNIPADKKIEHALDLMVALAVLSGVEPEELIETMTLKQDKISLYIQKMTKALMERTIDLMEVQNDEEEK
jgi:hypothetical protein